MNHITPGTVILVTGATGAIGFEIAAQAAEAGVIVGIQGASMQTVSAAMVRLRARVGPQAQLIAAPCDFRVEGQIGDMIETVVRESGRLDAVIHCAITGAKGVSGLLSQSDSRGFGAHAALVLGSFQQVCYAALPHLASKGGTIVGFASDAGRFAAPGQSVIGAAFGGVMSFARNLSMETARDKVRVHCISLSYVEDTPIFEHATAGRAETARARAGLGLPTPADIAPLALFLCGPGAARITGQIISINGGLNA